MESLLNQDLLLQVATTLSGNTQGTPKGTNLFADLQAPNPADMPLEARRWRCDILALATQFHCSHVHEREAPTLQPDRWWFTSLERARIMALGCQTFRGVRVNLEQGVYGRRSEDWLWVSIFLESIGRQVVEPHLQLVWEDLVDLKKWLPHQTLFAQKAREVCPRLIKSRDERHKQDSNPKASPPTLPTGTATENLHSHCRTTEGLGQNPGIQKPPKVQKQNGYSVYSASFDEEIRAETLASFSEQLQYRAQFDQFLRKHPKILEWGRKLQRYLQAKHAHSWRLRQDEGYLDGSLLAQLVASPQRLDIFKQDQPLPKPSTAVTLLLDNSASMQGTSIMLTLWTAEYLARILERDRVKVEILGYTTTHWRGGPVKKLWESHGRPSQPGRLNALRHIIYKTAQTPWRRARLPLTVALKPGLLKENVDGEALHWAQRRLQNRPEHRKVLIVISDGAPADRATQLANPRHLLEAHLQRVVTSIETSSSVELAAIGIGHDVRRWYTRAICIRSAEELEGAIETLFVELLQT
ncbi:MAG: hypothetical protein KTR25_16055 [Myxococcales bacterium]|nr:hypothetical protein [Myxococcales bacterium]